MLTTQTHSTRIEGDEFAIRPIVWPIMEHKQASSCRIVPEIAYAVHTVSEPFAALPRHSRSYNLLALTCITSYAVDNASSR